MLKTRSVAFPSALRAFLESGSALILASVDEHGTPHASRAWGLDVVSETTVRLLLDGDDEQLHANLAANGAVAITASSVTTLRSIQLKGRATAPGRIAPDDPARMQRYCEEFFADVQATDGVPRHLLERIVPGTLATCDVEIDAVFDQTPGPRAGTALADA